MSGAASWTLWSKREMPSEDDALRELQDALRGRLAGLAASLPQGDAFAALLRDGGEASAMGRPGGEVYDACLRRFLLHNDLDATKAKQQLLSFVAWRTSSNIGMTPASAMRGVAGGLPVILVPELGEGNATLLFSSGRHFLKRQCEAAAHSDAVARLFEALLYAADGAQGHSAVLVADFEGVTLAQVDMPAFRRGLALFQSYYPQTFRKVLLVAYPKFVHGVWRAVRPLLDPRTVDCVEWYATRQDVTAALCKLFDKDQIPTWLGGNATKWTVDVLSGVDDPAELQRELTAKYRDG